MSSAIRRQLAAFELRNRSAKASVRAIKITANSLTSPRERDAAMRIAATIDLCAACQRSFLITPVGKPTKIIFSSPRACKNRFICPPCARAAADLHREKLRELIDIAAEIGPANFRGLFLTLTARSRPLLTELPAMLADHTAGLKRYFRGDRIKSTIRGHYTAIELTVGRNRRGEPTAHLHSHSIIIVDGDTYFAGGYPAIHHAHWRQAWRDAARLAYLPMVNVKAIKGPGGETDVQSIKVAAVECAKYVLSPGFYEHGHAGPVADGAVLLAINRAFKRQRLFRYDGLFAEAMKIRRQHNQQPIP
jgi:hypothetical protein